MKENGTQTVEVLAGAVTLRLELRGLKKIPDDILKSIRSKMSDAIWIGLDEELKALGLEDGWTVPHPAD